MPFALLQILTSTLEIPGRRQAVHYSLKLLGITSKFMNPFKKIVKAGELVNCARLFEILAAQLRYVGVINHGVY